jgi:PucR C-terminal helix-turn-helix domain/GGDEF-like domain
MPSGLLLSSEEERGWERIVRPLAELSTGVEHDMAVDIAAEIRRRLPVGSASFDLMVAAAETGFTDIVGRVVNGTAPSEYRLSPEAVLYAREIAQQGHSIDVLFWTGHIGGFHIQRTWLGDVEPGSHDPGLILGAVGYWEQFMFAWGQQLIHQWKQVYLDERSRSIDASDALRAAAVRQVLAGAPGYDNDGAGREIRYDLAGAHRAFILWCDDAPGDSDTLRRHANRVARALDDGEFLIVPWGDAAAAGWAPGAGALPHARLRALVASHTGPAPRVAFGSVHTGVDGFRRSHEEALEARRVAQLTPRPGPIHEYRSLALTALATSDLTQARRFVTEELGPLGAQDDATVRIAATLKVWFEELGNAAQAARRMGLHKNTVQYRVQRAEQLLGRPIGERALELQIALTLARTLGEDEPTG